MIFEEGARPLKKGNNPVITKTMKGVQHGTGEKSEPKDRADQAGDGKNRGF